MRGSVGRCRRGPQSKPSLQGRGGSNVSELGPPDHRPTQAQIFFSESKKSGEKLTVCWFRIVFLE